MTHTTSVLPDMALAILVLVYIVAMSAPPLESVRLQHVLLKSDRVRITCILGLVVFLEIVVAVRIWFFGSSVPHWVFLPIAAFGFYELSMLFAVNGALAKQRVLPQALWHFNIAIEMCMPGLGMAYLVGPRLTHEWAPLASQFGLTFFPLMILTILRLSPRFCYFGAILATTSYFLAAHHHGWRISIENARHSTAAQSGVLVYGAIILTSGFIAGIVAREMRKYVEAAVLEADTLFQARVEERIRERTRIARDLHDTLLQSFQALVFKFQAVCTQLHPGELKELLSGAIQQAADAINEARDAVQLLRTSTDQTSLDSAVRALGEQLAANEGIENAIGFRVVVEGSARKLHPIVHDECYRIANEALRNAFQHAHASQITFEIRYNEKLFKMRIMDDGAGIDPQFLDGTGRPGHYGLRGMRERAKLVGSELDVRSQPSRGTEVLLTIPAEEAYLDLEHPSS